MIKAPPPPPPPALKDRAHQLASAVPPPAGDGLRVGMYWQVMGNTETPAIELFRQLKTKGFQSAMHASKDSLVRVVVGPFFDVPSAQNAKTALEAAGFRAIRKWE
jgi:cell division septation protein DedD